MEDSFQQDAQGLSWNSSDDEVFENDQIAPYAATQPTQNQIPQQKMPKQLEIKQQLGIGQTPTQFFEFNEDNAVCKICYKYAINAVICKNQKCSVLFCGVCAVEAIKKIQNKCPFCRVSPFQCSDSPFKNIINKMELVCQLCHQKYLLQEEQIHYKKTCLFFNKIQCQFCPQMLEKNTIIKHTRLNHEDKLDEIIQKMYLNPPPILDPKQLIAKRQFYLNKINRVPHLGTSGKFYCGHKLEAPKCSCCNGYCGPTNGQNCYQCMKMDLLRLGLPKGHLVNSSGHPCWKKGQDFICNVMIYSQNSYCKEGNPCRSCFNMKKNIKRYQNLL